MLVPSNSKVGGTVPNLPNDANCSLDGTGVFSPTFAMRSDWSNAISDYSASGVLTSTTIASSVLAGSTIIYLTNASTFKASQGISIVGAGTANTDHTTTISSVNTTSNYVVLNVPTVSTVLAGAVVYHDDTVALNSQWNDTGTSVNSYLGGGDFIISSPISRSVIGRMVQGSFLGMYSYTTGTKSTIWVRFTGVDAINLMVDECLSKNFIMSQHPSIAATGGAFIGCGSDLLSVKRPTIDNLVMNDCWIGLRRGQGNNARIKQLSVRKFKKNGVLIDHDIPSGGDTFKQCLMIGDYAADLLSVGIDVGAGVRVVRSDWNRFNNLWTFGCKYGIEIDGTTGLSGLQLVNGFQFDATISGAGIYVHGSGANCYANNFVDGYMNLLSGAKVYNLDAASNKNSLSDILYTTGATYINSGIGNTFTNVRAWS